MQTDLMSDYIRRRMEHWGEEFALHKDCEYLGHASKNLLAVLMGHHEMPGRATGYKPLEINPEAQQIEDAVFEISRHAPAIGWVLRAYYCGQGRRKIERWHTANSLLQMSGCRPSARPATWTWPGGAPSVCMGCFWLSQLPHDEPCVTPKCLHISQCHQH